MNALTATLGSLILLVTGGASQKVAPPFRWSERLAHELDYNKKISTTKALSPQERRDLLAFILHRFQKPASETYEFMLEGVTDQEMRKLARDTRIEMVDLNGDGVAEVIAQGNGFGACGATGNCIVLVLEHSPNGLRLLFDSYAGKDGGGYEKIRVLDTFTNGSRDIVLAAHESACERTASVLRFDGKQYRERECYNINWCTGGGTISLSKPEIGACSK